MNNNNNVPPTDALESLLGARVVACSRCSARFFTGVTPPPPSFEIATETSPRVVFCSPYCQSRWLIEELDRLGDMYFERRTAMSDNEEEDDDDDDNNENDDGDDSDYDDMPPLIRL